VKHFAVGDDVWEARCGSKTQTSVCPVCYGKLAVTVTLGNGEFVRVPCDCCGLGYEIPRGEITEHVQTFEPRRATVRGLRIDVGVADQTADSYDLEYGMGFGDKRVQPELVFATEAEAQVQCAVERAKYGDSADRRLRVRRDGSLKRMTWLIGYHKAAAAEGRRRAAYHDGRIQMLVREPVAEARARSSEEAKP